MSELSFDGRTALVTGGARGIGRAHASLLARRGCQVVIADAGLPISGIVGDAGNQPDVVDEAAAELSRLGGKVVGFRGDVLTDAAAMVRHAVDSFGGLDIVINNAGPVASFVPLVESTPQAWERVFDVHLKGSVAVIRAAWPHLVASTAGRIVNTASIALLGSEAQTDYGSAKAALLGLTRSLALEARKSGITVNTILPSAFTRMVAETLPDQGVRDAVERIMGPEHIASFVAWLVHAGTEVTGEAFNISGGRAARVVLASGPPVVCLDDTPEAWRNARDRLLADGPYERMTTMMENFGREIADIDPSVADQLASLAGGLAKPE